MTGYIAFTSVQVPPRFLVRNMQPAETYAAPLFGPPITPETLTIDVISTGAFGSGAHPTTQLCLTLLAEHVTSQSSVLDLGCGSGVLAIGAAKLGARIIVAVDIEQAAVIRTQDNAALNGVADRIGVRLGSTEAAAPDAPYSVIVGNLLTPIILKLAPLVPPLLAPDGVVILSGILDVQADRVREGLSASGLNVIEARSKSGWCALVAAMNSK
jgi:ribosomal protein L11 methyltransferase